jgi:hypothetical protein
MNFIYCIEICREDGKTPMGECPVVEVEAKDRHEAIGKVLKDHPQHEVVSWGRKDEIEAYRLQE